MPTWRTPGITLHLPLFLPPFAVLYSLVLFTFPFSVFLIFFCFILILSYHYPYFFQFVSFPQSFPPKSCTHLSYSLYVPHGPHISFSFVWTTGQYLVRSADYEAPRQEKRPKHQVILCFPVLFQTQQSCLNFPRSWQTCDVATKCVKVFLPDNIFNK